MSRQNGRLDFSADAAGAAEEEFDAGDVRHRVDSDDGFDTAAHRRQRIEEARNRAVEAGFELRASAETGGLARPRRNPDDGVHIDDSADRRARTLFREAAAAFVREAFQVISADEVNLSRDYETGITLAVVTSTPPPGYIDDWEDGLPTRRRENILRRELNRTKAVEIKGLRGFVNAQSPIRFGWVGHLDKNGRREQITDEYVDIAELSWGEIHDAIELTTHALDESGIGFEFKQDQRWEI